MIRSLGGWGEFKKSRGRSGQLKGDQRILGESEFVSDILAEADEKFEHGYELKRRGYDLKTIEGRVCEIFANNFVRRIKIGGWMTMLFRR